MRNYPHIALACLLLGSFSSHAAFRFGENVLSCKELFKDGPLTDCHLQQEEISNVQSFEADFQVTYLFPCKGHWVDIGLETENGYL